MTSSATSSRSPATSRRAASRPGARCEDHTTSRPPGRSAERAAARPAGSYSGALEACTRKSGPLSTSRSTTSHGPRGSLSPVSTSRTSATCRVQRSPSSPDSSGASPERAQPTSGAASSTTSACRTRGSASTARVVIPRPRPPTSTRWGDRCLRRARSARATSVLVSTVSIANAPSTTSSSTSPRRRRATSPCGVSARARVTAPPWLDGAVATPSMPVTPPLYGRRTGGPARWRTTGGPARSCGRERPSEAVETQLAVVEADGLTRAGPEGGVGVVVVARHGVHRGLGLLGRLHRDVAVAGQTRARRDELAEDDVLLEPEEGVGLALHRGLGEDAGGLLEGRRRQPRLGRERGLGDAHELGTTRGRLAALGHDATVLVLEAATLGEHARQEVGVALLDDRDPAQHLPDDHLDVLVVDRHTLLAVDLLDLVDEVHLHRTRAEDAQHLLGVDRPLGQARADRDVLAVLHQQAGPLGDRVGVLLGAVVGREQDATRLVGLLDGDPARRLGDRGDTLGGARLEQLDDTRQTLGDVVTGHTTGVEGTHRQLGAGLTDGLRGDDADRLTDVDELAGGERTAVAERAGADLGVAGEHRADLHRVDAGREQRTDDDVTEVDAGRGQHLTVLDDVLGERARVDRGLDVVVHRAVAGALVRRRDRHRQATVGAAVVLTDDDVLRHVDQTTGQVPRVGGAQRGVGQALAGTVRGDEELQHGQTLAEVRADRSRDDVALRVRHQATHTGDLAQLHPVTTSTRGDHPVDGVGARQVRLHLLGDLVGRLGPDLDELLATLVVGDQTTLVLGLDLGGLLLVALEDLELARRRDDVGDGDRGARAGRPVEAVLLERVEARRDLHLAVALGEVVDDRRQALLVDLVVDERVVEGQRLVEERAP